MLEVLLLAQLALRQLQVPVLIRTILWELLEQVATKVRTSRMTQQKKRRRVRMSRISGNNRIDSTR